MASVRISCSALSPTTVTVHCSSISYGLRKNNTVNPIENGTDMAEVNTRSFDNPRITLNNVLVTNVVGTFDMNHALVLMALKDGVSTPVLLDIDYGRTGSSYGLPKWTTYGTSQTEIPVIFDSATFNIDAQDSAEGYLPTGTLSFIQTRE